MLLWNRIVLTAATPWKSPTRRIIATLTKAIFVMDAAQMAEEQDGSVKTAQMTIASSASLQPVALKGAAVQHGMAILALAVAHAVIQKA